MPVNNYSGWKQIGNISIIYSVADTVLYNGKFYPKAFIAESSNAKSIESGIAWAKGWNRDKEPKIVETENKDFSFQIISAARKSYSQGGKLSFWMCAIEKPGIDSFAVGINSDLLCDLILESNLTNGHLDKKVFFARNSGQLGVIHEDMSSYKELIKDEQLRQTVSKGKTTKWRIGYKYETLTTSDIMLGKFAKIVSISGNTYHYDSGPLRFTLDFNKHDYNLYDSLAENSNIDEIYEQIIDDLEYDYLKPKCPSKQESIQVFEETATYYNDIVNTILSTLDTRNNNKSIYYTIQHNINKAFSIFRHDKNATIKILEKTKDWFNTLYSELDTSKPLPKWADPYGTYEKNIKNGKEFTFGLFETISYSNKSETDCRQKVINKVINTDIYHDSKGLEISYNDKIETYNSWSDLLDRLIEIVKIER